MNLITRNLMKELNTLNEEALQINWIIAFAMKSGALLMLDSLKRAHDRGADIQILVGDYLCITQPEALSILHNTLPHAEIRLYETHGISFHPKAYLYRHSKNHHLIVGSSNLSKSALTRGVEWNLHTVNNDVYEQAADEFEKIFYAENTVPVNTFTIDTYRERYEIANQKIPIAQKWDEEAATDLMYGPTIEKETVMETPMTTYTFEPRPAQKIALQALQETTSEGHRKAMAVLATGLGKTYLAAFFAENYKRVLFVAHREEILEQAKIAFSHVHPKRSTGFYSGQEKNTDADMTFASIYTLSRKEHLEKFEPNTFDLIIIDEFHHAAAPTYHRLLQYFDPAFLLGITATPDRLDNKDVYNICDGNVAIEINFLEAIAHKWLSPFHYFGVKDEIDYNQIRWLGNGYDEEALTNQQLQEDVIEHVYEKWMELKQTRTIAFCSSIKQANFMAHYFEQRGMKAIALSGQSKHEQRKNARIQLNEGALDIIFTVDLFNEGVDIPKVDTLLFIRPTESLAIFTQQIGRGLRLADGKEKCVIIDFLGNYRNVDRKLKMLNPNLTEKNIAKLKSTPQIEQAGSVINLELEVVDLLQEMTRKNQSYRQKIITAFKDLKNELGRRPTYLEMYLQCGYEDLNIAKEFSSYVNLLAIAGDLSEQELQAFKNVEQIIFEIEKTLMTKSYKMLLLKIMLERGPSKWYSPITADEVAPGFASYLAQPTRRVIDKIDMSPAKVTNLIQRMPMTKWSSSSKGLATLDNATFQFNISIDSQYENIVFEWVQQICEFRLHRYFAKKAEKLDI